MATTASIYHRLNSCYHAVRHLRQALVGISQLGHWVAFRANRMNKEQEKAAFLAALRGLIDNMGNDIKTADGQWTVKGFIDVYRSIYTISSDTKIVSKILEIHLLPKLSAFAEEAGYAIVLAEHQNYYPDMSFVKKANKDVKFAVDFKTTYRLPNSPDFCNGFTLGSHGEYFINRSSTKNIQFPISNTLGIFAWESSIPELRDRY